MFTSEYLNAGFKEEPIDITAALAAPMLDNRSVINSFFTLFVLVLCVAQPSCKLQDL